MRVGIVAPMREACGISDYTRALVQSLESEVEIAYVTDPARFRPDMNSVDIVHVQHEYFVFGGVAPWKNRFPRFIAGVRPPVVMTVHEIVDPKGSAAFRWAIRRTNRMSFGHASIRHYITHTEQDSRRLADIGVPSGRTQVIRLGVPDPPELPNTAAAKQKLGLEGRFVLTIFGFIARKKGHLAALEALRLLPPDVTLLIAGGRHKDDTTDYVATIEERARQFDVRARITGYLPADEIPYVMAATDLVLAPFTETSGSASLAQAYACGLPILASDIGPHREIAKDTRESLRLVAGDPELMAGAVVDLRRDLSALTRLRAGARLYAERHSMGRTAELTAAVYREAAAGVRR